MRSAFFLYTFFISSAFASDISDHGGGITAQLRRLTGLLPAAPARVRRGARCSSGQYYSSNTRSCQTCTSGRCCHGDDTETDCDPGYYSGQGHTTCTACPLGTYCASSGCTSCKSVSAGYKANKSVGATDQTVCPSGTYSRGSTDTCTDCPAGYYCSGTGNTGPSRCGPGKYMATSRCGKSECDPCPAGTFNNVYGATSCCKCCSGFYASSIGSTSCTACAMSGGKKQGSPAGATTASQCSTGLTNYAPTCTQGSSGGSCPATTGTPTASSKAKRTGKMLSMCPNPLHKRCPVSKARSTIGIRQNGGEGGAGAIGIDPIIGPYECIDTKTNLESCGGCVLEGEVYGQDGGQDCTAIEHMSSVKCVNRKCVVGACRSGYTVSSDKVACIKTQRHKQRGQHSHNHNHSL